MKKLFLSLSVMCLTLILNAQSGPIEDMFNKYSEREGFTLVSISSKMFSMFAGQENKNPEAGDIINRLKSIKILTVEDSLLNKNLNCHTRAQSRWLTGGAGIEGPDPPAPDPTPPVM